MQELVSPSLLELVAERTMVALGLSHEQTKGKMSGSSSSLAAR